MKVTYNIRSNEEGDIYQQIHHVIEKQPWTWQSIAAVAGLIGAVICPLIGILLGTATWFLVSPRAIQVLHLVSVGAFALTIPLLLCGAHCLDLIEKNAIHPSPSNRRSFYESVSLKASAKRGR